MTLYEAVFDERYKYKWFIFIFTGETFINAYDDVGYVSYTFDREEEINQEILSLVEELDYIWASGSKAYTNDEIGGLYYND